VSLRVTCVTEFLAPLLLDMYGSLIWWGRSLQGRCMGRPSPLPASLPVPLPAPYENWDPQGSTCDCAMIQISHEAVAPTGDTQPSSWVDLLGNAACQRLITNRDTIPTPLRTS
jgi:hypothetical protein